MNASAGSGNLDPTSLGLPVEEVNAERLTGSTIEQGQCGARVDQGLGPPGVCAVLKDDLGSRPKNRVLGVAGSNDSLLFPKAEDVEAVPRNVGVLAQTDPICLRGGRDVLGQRVTDSSVTEAVGELG